MMAVDGIVAADSVVLILVDRGVGDDQAMMKVMMV